MKKKRLWDLLLVCGVLLLAGLLYFLTCPSGAGAGLWSRQTDRKPPGTRSQRTGP